MIGSAPGAPAVVRPARPRLPAAPLLAPALGVALALVPVAAPGNITVLNLGFFTFLYVAQGLAWNILGGFAGYVSFGYAAFFGLGAYTTALLWLGGWTPVLTFPVGGLVAAVFSLIVGVPTLRLVGPYFSIATIGVGEAMRILMLNLDRITGGASGLNLPTAVPSKAWFYTAALLMAAVAYAAATWIRGSRFGLGLAALRMDLEAAETLGVRTALFKNVAHMISAFLVGVCGGLFATYFQYLHPDTVFSFTESISLVLIALIGGLGTIWGPILGAAVFYAVQDYLQTSYPTFHLLAYGILLIVILLFEPRGLAGLAARIWGHYRPGAPPIAAAPAAPGAFGPPAVPVPGETGSHVPAPDGPGPVPGSTA
ncbi:MAG TPA: branched-chain amino acid ABC transporter permease [bacterium]|nr:branched-chain amino acid ABC transporter permease [bacterium]